MPSSRLLFVLVAWALAALVPAGARGQFDLLSGKPLGGATGAVTPFHVQAELRPAGQRQAELLVTTTIDPGWHIYSITQGKGGPQPTLLALERSPDYRPITAPKADPEPRRENDPLFNNLLVETHEGTVTWRGMLELSPTARLDNLTVRGSVAAQACSTQCIPRRKVEFTARLAGAKPAEPAKSSTPGAEGAATPWSAHSGNGDGAANISPAESFAAGPYRAPQSHATVSARFAQGTVKPGDAARLVIRIEPDPGWHAYALAPRDPEHISKPTLIVLTETGGLTATPPVASRTAEEKTEPDGHTVGYYTAPVDFELELRVPRDARPGRYAVAGLIGYQTCEGEARCDRPLGAAFRGEVVVATDQAAGTPAPISFASSRYRDAARLAAGTSQQPGNTPTRHADTATTSASGFDIKRIVVEGSQEPPRSALLNFLKFQI